jgi:hypothetical protein
MILVEALEVLERHAVAPLVTSNHVRGETWTFLRRRSDTVPPLTSQTPCSARRASK